MGFIRLRFTESDARSAHKAWGCNCGPTALAAALGMTLDEVRPFMGPFEQRGYTNITNMRNAISLAGGSVVRQFESWPPSGIGLVRIQWGGPWIIDGKPARWAATATHWVAACRSPESNLYIFDVNGGLRTFESWRDEIAPLIMQSIKRCDGTWTISHSWQVQRSIEFRRLSP